MLDPARIWHSQNESQSGKNFHHCSHFVQYFTFHILPRLHHWLLSTLKYPPSGTETFQSTLKYPPSWTETFQLPLLVSGTIYLNTSLLHLCCLYSGHTSVLISLPFPTPAPYLVHCLRSDNSSFWTLLSFMLLTYLYFSSLTSLVWWHLACIICCCNNSLNFLLGTGPNLAWSNSGINNLVIQKNKCCIQYNWACTLYNKELYVLWQVYLSFSALMLLFRQQEGHLIYSSNSLKWLLKTWQNLE